MQLKTYRTQNDLTLADVAEKLRTVGLYVATPRTVHRHETGEREPSFRTIEAYRKITGDAVRGEDWLEMQAERDRAAAPESQLETVT